MNRVDIRVLTAMLECRDRLSGEGKQTLANLSWRVRRYERGEEIVGEGSRPSQSCLLLEGWAARSGYLSNGRRQLTAVHIAGDFVDLLDLSIVHTHRTMQELRAAGAISWRDGTVTIEDWDRLVAVAEFTETYREPR